MLDGMPAGTVTRFSMKYVRKAFTYAAVHVKPDWWYLTGDMPCVSSYDLVQMIDKNGKGDIHVFPPRESEIDPQIWVPLGGGDWETGDY
jgi:hypothetical protein